FRGFAPFRAATQDAAQRAEQLSRRRRQCRGVPPTSTVGAAGASVLPEAQQVTGLTHAHPADRVEVLKRTARARAFLSTDRLTTVTLRSAGSVRLMQR